MSKRTRKGALGGHPDSSSAGSGMGRRAFLQMAGTAAAGSLLSACAAGRQTSKSQVSEKTQLVYQDWRTEWFPSMAQTMLEEFHATHPNIRVFYTPDPENFEEKVMADMQAGTAPDVFQACCSFFPTLAQNGYTLDLRSYARADLDQATIDDWDQAQYRSFFTTDGRQYGLPKYHGALALYFNRDLFDQKGVDYPDGTWDHEDYRLAMLGLTGETRKPGRGTQWGSICDISWDRIQTHVNGWGGHFVDPKDPTRCVMAEPAALAAMEWLRARIWDDYLMASPLDVENLTTRQAFMREYVAMVEDGSWALKDILAGAKFRIGVAPFPAGPARQVTLSTTDGFGIYAGTRHPEAAWELMKFLISKEYGRAMARANFLQPARASLVHDWIAYIREEFPEQTRDVDLAAFADGHIKGYSVTAEVFANMADATQPIYAAWDRIFTLGQAPVTVMKDVCEQVHAAQTEG
jgi:multiple sugar transport system substrate-binding protein